MKSTYIAMLLCIAEVPELCHVGSWKMAVHDNQSDVCLRQIAFVLFINYSKQERHHGRRFIFSIFTHHVRIASDMLPGVCGC